MLLEEDLILQVVLFILDQSDLIEQLVNNSVLVQQLAIQVVYPLLLLSEFIRIDDLKVPFKGFFFLRKHSVFGMLYLNELHKFLF